MPGSLPNFEPAPAPLPEEVQQARDSMRQYFDDTVHPNDSYSVYFQLVDDLDTLELHITAQARRLAEVEESHRVISKSNRAALHRMIAAEARVRELEAQIAASKKNERRWIAKGEEAIAERNAANTALEAIKKHQEIVAGTGAAQMSTTWKIADAHLRSIGATRAALAATESSCTCRSEKGEGCTACPR